MASSFKLPPRHGTGSTYDYDDAINQPFAPKPRKDNHVQHVILTAWPPQGGA